MGEAQTSSSKMWLNSLDSKQYHLYFRWCCIVLFLIYISIVFARDQALMKQHVVQRSCSFDPCWFFCKLCEHQACASACSHFIIFQLSSCHRQHIEYLLTWSFLFLAAVPTVTHNCSHVLHWFTCFSTFTFYPLLTFHPFPQATDHPSAVWWQDSARKTTWALQASTCLATSWRPRMAPSTCKARFNLSQKAGRVNLWTWNKRLILHPFR